MNHTLKPTRTLTWCLAFAVGTALIGCDRPDSSDESPFPEQTRIRMKLPSAQSGKAVQYDTYQDDKRTLKSSHIAYANGDTEYIHYHANGLKSESERFLTGNRLKDKAMFALDGQTYTYHDVYRADGTMERTGRLLLDGRYETRYLFSDGKTAERIRLFDAKKGFLSEQYFRWDGTLQAEIMKVPDTDELYITLYTPSEVRSAAFYTSPIRGDRGEVYGADGKTIMVVFVRETGMWPTWKAEYFDERGVLVKRSIAQLGLLTVTALDPRPGRSGFYKQVCRVKRDVMSGVDTPFLRSVEEISSAGETTRLIEIGRDGQSPVAVTYPNKSGHVVHSDQPTLAKVEPELLKVGLVGELPTFKDFGPPRVYDYENPQSLPTT